MENLVYKVTMREAGELGHTLHIFRQLQKIAKTLHRLDENACNYGLSKAQETRLCNLEDRAQELASSLGYFAYHQGDPRGCSLYLTTPDMRDYSNGIAIY